MSLVEAALLDQMRRVLEMDPASLPKQDLGVAVAWCRGCGQGIGQTKPNRSGYCSRRACKKLRDVGRPRQSMKRERAA